MKYLITILISLSLLGVGYQPKLSADVAIPVQPIKEIKIKDVNIQENEVFAWAYPIWEAADILEQLDKQGIPIETTQQDEDFATKIIKEADFKLKKYNIIDYKVKYYKDGVLINTKTKTVK